LVAPFPVKCTLAVLTCLLGGVPVADAIATLRNPVLINTTVTTLRLFKFALTRTSATTTFAAPALLVGLTLGATDPTFLVMGASPILGVAALLQ
jgi:hypothetical protein